MHYITKPKENPAFAIHGLSEFAGSQKLEVVVVGLSNVFAQTLAVRVAGHSDPSIADAVYISETNNPVFVANAIVLTHKHNFSTQRARMQQEASDALNAKDARIIFPENGFGGCGV